MNNLNKIELVSYEEFPEDEYTLAIATVCIDNEHVVSYAKKKTKEGNFFWSTPTIGVKKGGSKVYVECYLNNSRIKEKKILEFIKEKTRTLAQGGRVELTASLAANQNEASNEQLPF